MVVWEVPCESRSSSGFKHKKARYAGLFTFYHTSVSIPSLSQAWKSQPILMNLIWLNDILSAQVSAPNLLIYIFFTNIAFHLGVFHSWLERWNYLFFIISYLCWKRQRGRKLICCHNRIAREVNNWVLVGTTSLDGRFPGKHNNCSK